MAAGNARLLIVEPNRSALRCIGQAAGRSGLSDHRLRQCRQCHRRNASRAGRPGAGRAADGSGQRGRADPPDPRRHRAQGHAGHPDHRPQRQLRRGRRICRRRRRCRRQAVPFRSARRAHRAAASPAPGRSRNCAPTMPRSTRGWSPGRSRWAKSAPPRRRARPSGFGCSSWSAATSGQKFLDLRAQVVAVERDRQIGQDKPALSPQSWRTASTLSAWNGCRPISLAMPSVSWISPPAPRSPLPKYAPSLRAGGCSGRRRRAATALLPAWAFRPGP